MTDAIALYAARYERPFQRKPEERRYQQKLAKRLLLAALQQEYGIDGESLVIGRGAHGKPYFENSSVQFNLSHCGENGKGLVCCALSRFEVGVDCAPLRPYDERLARRICTTGECSALRNAADPGKALMTLWTQKESYMKWSGKGFRQGFRVEVASLPAIFTKTYDAAPGFLITLCSGHAALPRKVKWLDPAR